MATWTCCCATCQVSLPFVADGYLGVCVESLLSYEQYERRQSNWYSTAFELHARHAQPTDSYLLMLFEELYGKLSQHWRIDIAVLDYNLARLRQLEVKHAFHFSLTDLPVALEFYLQMDVDMFHLKTCSFRQAHLTDDGIFAGDQRTVEGCYAFSPCSKRHCLYCRQSVSIRFHSKHTHAFLNQYWAILNCPAVRTLALAIVATCPPVCV